MNEPPSDHRIAPGFLPTPFSAAEIREASAPGRTYEFRIEPAGGKPYVDKWEFIGGDADTAQRRRWAEELDGTIRQDPEVERAAWRTLQAHASYPDDTTELKSEWVETPAGRFSCWVYTTTDPAGSVTRTAFAKDLSGPPVLMEARAADATVFRMVLLHTAGPG